MTRGERLAFIGRVTSPVRGPARREIIEDLDGAARVVFAATGRTPALDRLFKAKGTHPRIRVDD